MFWTLEGNKTGPCGCVCLESGVGGQAASREQAGPREAPEQDGPAAPPAGCAGAPPGVHAGSLRSLA